MPAPSALVHSLVSACRQVLRADGYLPTGTPVSQRRGKTAQTQKSPLARFYDPLAYSLFSFRHRTGFSPDFAALPAIATTACYQPTSLAARPVCGRDTLTHGELTEDSDSYP